MHLNCTIPAVGVYKMAVSMVCVVKCTGRMWNREYEIFTLLAVFIHCCVSTIWWQYIPPCCQMYTDLSRYL